MNIFYATDDGYARFAGISIVSLFENNKMSKEINVFIIDDGISVNNKEKIKSIGQKYKRDIEFLKFDTICSELKNKDGFSTAAYGRLFLSSLIKLKKIIYIDCDTIVNDSLEELYKYDLEDKIIGGVQDNVANYMRMVVGLGESDRYINSGVLLIDLEKFGSGNYEKKIIEFIGKYNGKVPHHDQGVINGVFKDKIKILHPKFNTMSQFWELNSKQTKLLYNIEKFYSDEEINLAKKNPTIVHFIEKFYRKPWYEGCTHPMYMQYLYYWELSPWDICLNKNKVNLGIEIRKFIYKNFNFNTYYCVEKILFEKRKRFIERKYKAFMEE